MTISNTGKRSTNLEGKCGQCKNYKPHIVKTWELEAGPLTLESCRGHCIIRPTENGFRYKQRTDACKKFDKVSI
jgi:hypothetical protein